MKGTLELFCKLNSETIVHCEWKDSKYCQKSCKFYREYIAQEQGKEEETYLERK